MISQFGSAERAVRLAASCVYAALVMDSALALIDAAGSILIEGRFADAQVFVRALASLRYTTANDSSR